ncbi:MAG: 3-hydroxyacyl-ACP dehydratase FabZ [Holosporales bacterium]|jgi:3-hydroxyacyl-[acyl-carrier-protein] dehydratase|nr:3-hydroxyacyl-ACP dehydratase FabZ [Holosporales bacterium]
MILYVEDIKKLIPHRYPFLMLDRVDSVVPSESCIAIKNVSNNEWFFEGHFPKSPIMPGVLIIEALAQTACVLAAKTIDTNQVLDLVYFTSIDSAKFKIPVVPGDTLRLEVFIEQRRGNKFWKFNGSAYVENQVVCISEFRAMVP